MFKVEDKKVSAKKAAQFFLRTYAQMALGDDASAKAKEVFPDATDKEVVKFKEQLEKIYGRMVKHLKYE